MFKKILLAIIFLFLVPTPVLAVNAPDFNASSLSFIANDGQSQAPADGITILKVSVILKDGYGNFLAGDTASIASPDDTSLVVTPAIFGIDSNGLATFQVTSTHVGTISINVTDRSQNVTLTGLGKIAFYSPTCHDTAPGSAPKLISVTAISTSKILLTWTAASDPVTYYLLAYGTESGNYIYGADNIGDKNTTSYTVGSLTPNKKYYFKIRAGNGCTPGAFSNELSAVTTLMVATIAPVASTTPTLVPRPTVQPVLTTPETTPEAEIAVVTKPTLPINLILPLVLAGIALVSAGLLINHLHQHP